MRFRFQIVALIFTLFSCSDRREFSKDPFDPNYNATKDDLKNWGFELTTADDGICVYEKQIDDNLIVYFYLNFDDQCFLSTGQGFLFALDSLDFNVTDDEIGNMDHEKYYQSNLAEFNKDSLKIVAILDEYDAVIASPVERAGVSSMLNFKVGRGNSIDNFVCTYSAYPNNIKSIDIVEMWK